MAALWPVSLNAAVFFCGALFLLALVSYWRAWRVLGWVLCLCFLSAGFIYARFAYNQVNTALFDLCGHWVTVEGVVSREADTRPEFVYYRLKVDRLFLGEDEYSYKAQILVKVPAPGPVYGYGDILKAHGILVRPDNPGNPGEFNYRDYLQRHGVSAILKVDKAESVTRLGVAKNLFARPLLLFKNRLLEVNRQTLSPDKAALVNGIVFGIQGEIPRQTWQLFSETGVVHILSVSGMHVGLVLACVLLMLNLFKTPKKWLAPAGTVVLILYALLSGMGPAVARSTAMGLLFLWAHYFGREQDWPTTLSAAALFCLFLNPLALYDIGFQLSFAATWGIFALGSLFKKLLERLGSWPEWLKSVVWVSLAAQVATLPLVAWYYSVVSPVSLPANIVAAPLTGLVMLFGFTASLLGVFSVFLAGLVNASTSLALDALYGLVYLLRLLPGSVVYVPSPPIWAVWSWYPLLGALVVLSGEKRWRPVKLLSLINGRAPVVAAVVIMLGLALWAAQRTDNRELFLHMIDVGQGDSIYIKTPDDKNILIDAGGWTGEFESGDGAGSRIVVPYLRRLGVKRIDALVITHPHEDHAGGAAAVARAFPVRMAVVSPFGFEQAMPANQIGPEFLGALKPESGLPPAYTSFLTYLTNHKTNVYVARAGDRLKCGANVEIYVLSPPCPVLKGTRSDENNASLVLLMKYGRHSFLLTGDIEIEAQEWLLRSGYDLRADVLKAPHHGSRYISPAFVEKVHPSLTLISVGKNNRFNMPAAETIKLLTGTGSDVYRTDEQGAVILAADGKKMRIKSHERLKLKEVSGF